MDILDLNSNKSSIYPKDLSLIVLLPQNIFWYEILRKDNFLKMG